MKRILLFMLLVSSSVFAADDADISDEAMLEASRALAKEFATTLQGELLRALSASGPSEAIKVCRDRAPEIADEIARRNGVKIGRTSLRFRNPQNIPVEWQLPVLQDFVEKGADAPPAALEYFERNPAPGISARYMQAIVAKPMCLACHGEPTEEIRQVLEAHYPHDRATGYDAGNIRGAFHITWPADAD